MYCRKCGNELRDDAVFCLECGTQIKQTANIGVENTEKKNKGNRKNVFILVVAFCVICIGVMLAVIIGSGKNPLKDETDANEQIANSDLEESQDGKQIVVAESMNPTEYQWLMIGTDTYDGEDNFLGCSTYEYSSTNQQLKWEMFNADYSLNTRQEYEYDDLDRIIHSKSWDGEGKLVSASDRIYEGDFTQPSEVVWYKEDGSIKYSNKYQYHPEYDKVEIVWEYNADGEEVNYKEFSFDEEGNYTGYRYCYPDGSLYESCVYDYDEAGNMETNEKYDKDNEKKEFNDYKYLDGKEVSYRKWNGKDEFQVWNTMEYDYAGNEIVRYYYNSEHELLNTVFSVYEPVWECDAVWVEPVNGQYLYENQNPIKEFCIWFGQEKFNIVNPDGTISKAENEKFPIKMRITINDTDIYTVEISTVMEKLSIQDDIAVDSIKLEILDEAGNVVKDEQLLPNMYVFE